MAAGLIPLYAVIVEDVNNLDYFWNADEAASIFALCVFQRALYLPSNSSCRLSHVSRIVLSGRSVRGRMRFSDK